jgi:hypothetical protein
MENLNAAFPQFSQCACSNAANDHGVNFLMVQSSNRIAGSICMMLIRVGHTHYLSLISLDDDEDGCGTKMFVNPTFDPFILPNRKTDHHIFIPPQLQGSFSLFLPFSSLLIDHLMPEHS